MGVAGCGKTTIGNLLSQRLNCPFYEGDDFHPVENIKKMSQGIPLNDSDRLPWLLALRNSIDKLISTQSDAVIACSALKQTYREILQGEDKEIFWIYLQGSYSEIFSRLQARQKHFLKAEMLLSQFQALEEPENVFSVSISSSPAEIVDKIIDYKER